MGARPTEIRLEAGRSCTWYGRWFGYRHRQPPYTPMIDEKPRLALDPIGANLLANDRTTGPAPQRLSGSSVGRVGWAGIAAQP